MIVELTEKEYALLEKILIPQDGEEIFDISELDDSIDLIDNGDGTFTMTNED